MQRTVSTWQNEYPESSFFYQLRENGTVSICLSNKPEPNVIYAELNHRASYLIKACDQISEKKIDSLLLQLILTSTTYVKTIQIINTAIGKNRERLIIFSPIVLEETTFNLELKEY